MSARFDAVPVLDVNINNINILWSSLVQAIKSATFIALDTELSGIGPRKTLMAKSLDDRYKGTAENAKTRSVVSLGVSCFKLTHVDTKQRTSNHQKAENGVTEDESCYTWNFLVQTYNIMALCSEDYVVEPSSLKFLVEHGFDFNRQYSTGIPYYRGKDKTEDHATLDLRKLFTELVLSEKPVVFHNALTDLVYLYQNFYSDLPGNMSSFIADLTEIFPGGVYDTKYITDYVHRLPASYLEYVFRRSQRDNVLRNESGHSSVTINVPRYPANDTINMCKCGLPQRTLQDEDPDPPTYEVIKAHICELFSGHGWCGEGPNCKRSHDIDLILDLDHLKQNKKSRKRKRRDNKNHKEGKDEDNEGSDCPSSDKQFNQSQFEEFIANRKGNSEICKAGCHRAGFDAFMTGFSLAIYLSKYGRYDGSTDLNQCGIDEFRNNVYLSGKDMPLTVVKSAFSKTSKDHKEKINRIKDVEVLKK